MSGRVIVLRGDAAQLPLPDASIDAIVTDPPYGLEFMGREWDTFKTGDGFRRSRNEADAGRDSVFGRTSRTSPEYITDAKPSAARIRERVDGRTNPASGKSTTRTPEAYVAGSTFQRWCEAWARECLRVLRPGGHLLAFGGTRTWHRLVCGIEDAGFEIRDAVADLTGREAAGLMWTYGSGFPKSLDVGKAIDRAGGASPREQAATLRSARNRAGLTRGQVAEQVGCTISSIRDWEEGRRRSAGDPEPEFLVPSPDYRERLADLLGYTADERVVVGIGQGSRSLYETGHRGIAYGAAATHAAQAWDGWGTALKPGWEPIAVARKPLAGTVAANVLTHGTGALNIDGCRVGHDEMLTGGTGTAGKHPGWDRPWMHDGQVRNGYESTAGRWPPNVLLSEDAAARWTGRAAERSVASASPASP